MNRIVAAIGIVLYLSAGAVSLYAQGSIVGLDTNGITYQVNQQNGALTEKNAEVLQNWSLGATTRKAGKFYYVAVPSGLTENALYTVNIATGVSSHVALDRTEAVRAMFFKGKKLYGVFYDGTGGTAGLYRIAPATGVTTLVLDLSSFDVEPIPGAFARLNGFMYMLVKPESDSLRRQLLRFKTRAGSARLSDVVDGSGNPVLCDKLKANAARGNFVCLAQEAAETQVSFCRLSLNGRATCLRTLPGIERIGGGHTVLTPNRNTYYAFAYVPGEPDNQRLLKLNARGVIKTNSILSTIMIGAHFAADDPDN